MKNISKLNINKIVDNLYITGMVNKLFEDIANYGEGEIEAIAVDDEAQIVYYSDEACCIRAYSTKVDQNEERYAFGKDKFTEDREGIAIYKNGKTKNTYKQF